MTARSASAVTKKVLPTKVSSTKSAKPVPKAKAVARKPIGLGLTEFTRNLKENVEKSATKKVEVNFGGTVRHIRFRPASEHQDIVDDLDEDCVITIAQLRKMPNSYRALALVGEKFLVKSGEHEVVMDRHPNFPPRVVVSHMDRIRLQARTAAQRLSDQRIRKTSFGMKEILEAVEAAAAKNDEIIRQNKEIAAQHEELISLLAEVSGKGFMTPDQEALLNRLKLAEDTKLAEERLSGRKTLYTEADLERNEVGTN